jgi:hypothetical protein
MWPPTIVPFNLVKSLCAILLGILLAGCAATTSLSAGAALGNAGVSAATTMRQAAVVSPADLQRLAASDAFMAGYYGSSDPAAMAQRQTLISQINQELAARAAVLGDLADTYAALANLATYDASGSFSTAFTALAKSADAYSALTKGPQLSAADTSLVATTGGALVALAQKEQIRVASARIVPLLEQVVAAMEKYQPAFTGFRDVVISQESDAAVVLYGSGLFSAVPALNAIGAPYGYAATANADKQLADPKNRAARTGLAAVQAAQLRQQIALLGTAFDQSLDALKKLPAQHAALANGTPVDFTQLAADISALQVTVSQMTAAAAAK